MGTPLSAFDRSLALARLAEESYDVLVVGGGATGAGVALDAAARGLRTALVEARDFASGTSSRSSKLVHGGLRYLQHGELKLVHESLVERQRLLANAPHLVTPVPFLIPMFGRHGAVQSAMARGTSTALWTYDLAGGLRIGHRHRRIGAEEIRAHFPTLRTERLVTGFVYYDARTDDARLTLALARTAVLDHGAVAVNYAPVTVLRADVRGRVSGARLAVCGGGPAASQLEVAAAVVVNATGVWSELTAGTLVGDEGPESRPQGGHHIRPAKGIHLTVPADRLPCDMALVVPVAGDRRSIFVVPWGDQVYLGTTDTDYQGPLDEPRATPEDVAYVLGAVNAAVTRPLSPADVTGTWAGLRPLVAGPAGARSGRTADLSRRHRVTVDAGGLVSVTGGKLTTYRKMAADTVDVVVGQLGRGRRRSPTRRLALHASGGIAQLRRPEAAAQLGTDPVTLEHLVSRHGEEAKTVLALVADRPDLGLPLVEGLPYLRAEAVHAARHEMALTLLDVLSRRTRALPRDARASSGAAPEVAALLAPVLGWDSEETDRQIAAFRAEVSAGMEAMLGAGDSRGAGAQAERGTGSAAGAVGGSTSMPGTSTPGTSTPGTSTPGTSTPGTSTPGTSTPGIEEPAGTAARGPRWQPGS